MRNFVFVLFFTHIQHLCSAFTVKSDHGISYNSYNQFMKQNSYAKDVLRTDKIIVDANNIIPKSNVENKGTMSSRRIWMKHSSHALFGILAVGLASPSNAADDSMQVSEDELQATYDNPNQPKAPEERSGLVVLRVAEVAQFQEKILRSIASGELEGVMVSPMQFVFGTDILLKNSNLDGNMKLMIYQEIPRKKRDAAIRNAVFSMNQLQDISKYAAAIQRDFKTQEMIELADMYRDLRVNLNQLYEYLPDSEREKYYGYFVAVTEYEKKIAEGTYNPDLDGILQFENPTPKQGYKSVF